MPKPLQFTKVWTVKRDDHATPTATMQAIAACWQSGAYRVEPLAKGQFHTVGDDSCARLWLTYQPERSAQLAALIRGETAQLTPEQQRQSYNVRAIGTWWLRSQNWLCRS